MLCGSVLILAGQYAGICDIMCAWHASMHGAALIRLCHSMECQQVEHMPVHIVRDNAMPAIKCIKLLVTNGNKQVFRVENSWAAAPTQSTC